MRKEVRTEIAARIKSVKESKEHVQAELVNGKPDNDQMFDESILKKEIENFEAQEFRLRNFPTSGDPFCVGCYVLKNHFLVLRTINNRYECPDCGGGYPIHP